MLKKIVLSSDPAGAVSESITQGGGRVPAYLSVIEGLKMPPIPGVRHKDVYAHSLQVMDNAIARETDGPDVILRVAALLHDIGKPATRRASSGAKTVTFDGHETVGAQMIPRVLAGQGFTRAEVRQITMLVRFHMRGYGYADAPWTDSGLRRLLTDTGNDPVVLGRLLDLFYSDVTTRHANKRRRIHAGIDLLRSDLDRVKAADARAALRPALDGNEVMEITGLAPGREVGRIMRVLSTDANIGLSRDEAEALVLRLLAQTPDECC